MRLQALSIALLVILTSVAQGQDLVSTTPPIEFADFTHQQLTKRIFEGERNMIAGLRNFHPLLETYLQSLWTGIKTRSPIDDAYFLSTVDFTRGYQESGDGRRGYQRFLSGQDMASRRIRLNNGERVAVYPDGYLDMMFVDLEDFDADTYELTDLRQTTWAERSCLVFSVIPKMPRSQGRFNGQIWVETSNFKIVRIKGIFTPVSIGHLQLRRFFGIGSIPLYFHFESIRQEVTPGNWLPSYSYFDENRTWRQIDRDAETDIHYVGHVFIWGYRDVSVETYADRNHQPTTIRRLDNEKLLGTPGIVEEGLDAIVRRISAANNIAMSDIECRVLLTTPIEVFNVGHTIMLSRGLLNILPDDSVIPVLLAHQMAVMLFGDSGVPSQNDEPVWQKGLALTYKSGYSNGIGYTSLLLTQLAQQSKQIPNLLRARFGSPFLDTASGLPRPATAGISATSTPSLVLRGKYTIDSWASGLQVPHERTSSVAADTVPSF